MTSEQRFASKPDMMEIVEVDLRSMCRICGLSKDNLIPIFEDEGLRNELHEKIIKYLPIIEVTIEDVLSISVCVQCTNVLLFWHELYTNCLQTDLKLKEMVQFHKDFEKMEQAAVETDEHLELEVQDLQEENEHLEQEEVTENPKDGMLSDHVYEDEEYVEEQELEENESENFVEAEEIPEKRSLRCSTSLEAPSAEQKQKLKKKHSPGSQLNKLDLDVVESAKVLADGKLCYQCPECKKCLNSPYTFTWHLRIHSGERPFPCNLCNKRFRILQGLTRHVKEFHDKKREYPCEICGKMFGNSRNVKEHRYLHTNEKKYQCEQCPKSFNQKASLFTHKKSHTQIFPYKCTFPNCIQAFRSKNPLKLHIRIHTNERPFTCDVCDRSFRIKHELNKHKLLHSNSRPFQCSLCFQQFKQKRYLIKHYKVHHSDADPDSLELSSYKNK